MPLPKFITDIMSESDESKFYREIIAKEIGTLQRLCDNYSKAQFETSAGYEFALLTLDGIRGNVIGVINKNISGRSARKELIALVNNITIEKR